MGVRVSQGGLPGGRQCLMKDKQELGKRLGLEQLDEQGQKSVSAVPFPTPPPPVCFSNLASFQSTERSFLLSLKSPIKRKAFCQ